MDWTTINEFVNTYAIALLALAAIIIFAWYQKKKKKKLVAPVTPAPKEEKQKFDFETFQTKTPETKKADVLTSIQELNKAMNVNSQELDQHIRADFEHKRKELEAIHARKEYIKTYGVELAKLYEKYLEREKHLTAMLINMEDSIKKTRQLE